MKPKNVRNCAKTGRLPADRLRRAKTRGSISGLRRRISNTTITAGEEWVRGTLTAALLAEPRRH